MGSHISSPGMLPKAELVKETRTAYDLLYHAVVEVGRGYLENDFDEKALRFSPNFAGVVEGREYTQALDKVFDNFLYRESHGPLRRLINPKPVAEERYLKAEEALDHGDLSDMYRAMTKITDSSEGAGMPEVTINSIRSFFGVTQQPKSLDDNVFQLHGAMTGEAFREKTQLYVLLREAYDPRRDDSFLLDLYAALFHRSSNI